MHLVSFPLSHPSVGRTFKFESVWALLHELSERSKIQLRKHQAYTTDSEGQNFVSGAVSTVLFIRISGSLKPGVPGQHHNPV